ncbi:hypothetical protein H257_09391 [Aphanomyces astaci]|uniref:Uncharacterized protein n=1 Tax=Aphanomyces astaci TaxID=112090 RepID=W4GBE1_APHAT|nr:hypothetical protein H257_09390 [Aphanomyces astaci]XP_009833897.1 hypothetical protein H257_09391 [Aphanomyces astaci]ETV76984.1 hypothetical protein H257_09390 [Aphanomyces astaci]ETV76985.1 hypothetical protein H257_09391 [Aphanomyces astaci]|eukprot:XP_009833896.1 hypothetical protein H257_09390 [Aphanomyces astaci]
MWNGKIGMWPFVSEVPVQRTNKNGHRGTIATSPIIVTKPVYRVFLVNNDNARPHIQVDDLAVPTAATTGGWRIQLVAQPAMSPDFNVLNLGLFNSIQALQHRQVVTCIDDLVAAVHAAFDELDFCTLDKTFVTLQKVMEESLKVGGDITYKLPRLHKDRLAKQGLLTSQLAYDSDVYVPSKR